MSNERIDQFKEVSESAKPSSSILNSLRGVSLAARLSLAGVAMTMPLDAMAGKPASSASIVGKTIDVSAESKEEAKAAAVKEVAKRLGLEPNEAQERFDFEVRSLDADVGVATVAVTEKKVKEVAKPDPKAFAKADAMVDKPLEVSAVSKKAAEEEMVKRVANASGLTPDQILDRFVVEVKSLDTDIEAATVVLLPRSAEKPVAPVEKPMDKLKKRIGQTIEFPSETSNDIPKAACKWIAKEIGWSETEVEKRTKIYVEKFDKDRKVARVTVEANKNFKEDTPEEYLGGSITVLDPKKPSTVSEEPKREILRLDRKSIGFKIEKLVQTSYEARLKRNPGLVGKLVIDLETNSDGVVESVKIKQSTLRDKELEKEIREKLKSLRFEKSENGALIPNIPIILAPRS